MPKHAVRATPSTSTRGRRMSSSGLGPMGAGLWKESTDAVHSAAARFSDPVAMDVVTMLSSSADFLSVVAAAFKKIGSTSVDVVKIDSRVVGFVEALGDSVMKAAEVTADTAAAFQRAHAERIAELEEGDPRQAAWDHSRNNR